MRILMSMFGWNDSGGGTILPRQTALALQAQGHEVCVVYSALEPLPQQTRYTVREWEDQGVKLYGIHNRPALFLDEKRPDRERNDPEVQRIFAHVIERFQPDIVHYHNFLGLSIGIAEIASAAEIPSFYTPYNFWLVCPTLYLNLPDLQLCQGVNASGTNCLNCTQAALPAEAYLQRRDQIRTAYHAHVGQCLASSICVRDLLVDNGYHADQVEILKFGNDRAVELWQEIGQHRPAAVEKPLTFGFLGAVIPIKGVHILIQAVQMLQGDFRVVLHGDGPEHYIAHLKALDQRGCVEFRGRFSNAEQGQLLAQVDLGIVPSVCYDHSPLVIDEFQAARVPVIGANIGGIPDYIRAGELFEAANPTDLARVLQGFLDHPEHIPVLQNSLEAPRSFLDYVNSLIIRYQQALANRPDRYRRQQIQRLLETTCKAGPLLNATTLEVFQDGDALALNISRPQDLQQIPQQRYEAAQWIRLAYATVAPALPPEKTHLIYPLLSPPSESNPEKLSDHTHQLVLPISDLNSNWPALVQTYCQTVPEDADLILILLVNKLQLEALEEQLMELFDSNGIDPEHIPELILLEQPDDQETLNLLHQTQGVLIPDRFAPELFWQSLAAPLICTQNLPDHALYEPIPVPNWLQPLAEKIGASVYQPALSREAHNQQMISRFEELIDKAKG